MTSQRMTVIDAVNAAMRQEMRRDESTLVLGQDVGRLGGVFRATDGLIDEFGPDRVVDMPLAEAAIVGSALGLAIAGFRPIVELQFLGFAHQAFHQIIGQVARFRYRSQGRFGIPMTIRAPFGGGVRTPELHADSWEAQYVHAAGLKVVAPSNPADAKGLLASAIRDPDPVLFLEPLRGYRSVQGPVDDADYLTPLGRAQVVRAGSDVTVVAYSYATTIAEQAAVTAGERGISAELIDLRTLSPMDIDTVVQSVRKTGRCVVVHEASRTGGLAGELIAEIQHEAFYSLEAPIERVTSPDTPFPIGKLEDIYLPDAAAVGRAIETAVHG